MPDQLFLLPGTPKAERNPAQASATQENTNSGQTKPLRLYLIRHGETFYPDAPSDPAPEPHADSTKQMKEHAPEPWNNEGGGIQPEEGTVFDHSAGETSIAAGILDAPR